MNNRYIKERSLEEIVALCKPFLAKKYDLSSKSDEWITSLVAVYHDQLTYGAEICDLVDVFFNEELTVEDEALEFMKDETINNTLSVFKKHISELEDFTKENIQACIKATQKEAKVKGKMLFMPIRIATTGIMHGPDLTSSIALIGKETILKRLEKQW